jgi:hypothetical protein
MRWPTPSASHQMPLSTDSGLILPPALMMKAWSSSAGPPGRGRMERGHGPVAKNS